MHKICGFIICLFTMLSCSKKGGGNDVKNISPAVSVTAELIEANPFTYQFKATAYDQDGDPIVFNWNFGEGTVMQGQAEVAHIFEAEKDYTVKVTASDGKSKPTEATITIKTLTSSVILDTAKKFQTIEGFGGFGSQKEYWSNGPFTSDEFVNTLIDDLGLTILRDNIPTSFEVVNDNNDPFNTDLSKFNLTARVAGHDETLNDHLGHLRKMKAAGLKKFVVSIWSPSPWMKYNNRVGNGTQNQNSAPVYTYAPTSATNQLKTDLYDEFAEYCVAYIKIIKQETGLDVYALSLQNEPRFSQFYASAVYDGAALRDVIKVVGNRLRDEGLATKIFLPEDVGWLQGVENMLKPTLDDAEARKYVSIVAVHGYDLDGITAGSANAQTWQTMYSWGAPYNMPLWMTETSGYANNQDGAMALAKAMYTALKFGNVSAWLFWSLSTSRLDEYSLMSSAGEKSKRYFVSKNFYRYIRPGVVRIDVAAPDNSKLFPLAFQHPTSGTTTIVIINDNKDVAKAIRLTGSGLPAQFKKFVTSDADNTKDYGVINATDNILIPANSVVTLYKEN